MKLPIYQVDAFSREVFGGNPAAVCLLEDWLPDETLQKIALENALPETAFIRHQNGHYGIRWFTPDIEMDLCGHATLAAAHVILNHLQPQQDSVRFLSNSGELTVDRDDASSDGDGRLRLNFPARKPQPVDKSAVPQAILDAFDIEPLEVLKARDYVLVFASQAIIQNLRPNQKILDQINLDPGGVCVTARGDKVDFVSRFFTPQSHIFEDPVTGSAHCSLIPYWSERLNKSSLQALQLSARGGELSCQLLDENICGDSGEQTNDPGDRVLIAGHAVTYLEGTIMV